MSATDTIHIAADNGVIIIWAENLDLWIENRPEDTLLRYPHTVSSQQLAEKLAAHGLVSPTHNIPIKPYLAHLPSVGKTQPRPPNTMDESSHDITVRPWLIDAAILTYPHSIHLLNQCLDRETLIPGCRLAPDAQYWAHTAGFAISLAARQLFVPTIDHQHPTHRCRWAPVITGPDLIAFNRIAAAMPPSARALFNPGQHPFRHRDNRTALHRFLTDNVDAIVRHQAPPVEPELLMEHKNGQPSHSHHDSWLKGLTSRKTNFHRTPEMLTSLNNQIDDWQAPINPRPNARHQLAFLIKESPHNAQLVTMLQSKDNPESQIPIDLIWDGFTIPISSPDDRSQNRRTILKNIGDAAVHSPIIEQALSHGNVARYVLTPELLQRFLNHDVNTLSAAGFTVTIPEDLNIRKA